MTELYYRSGLRSIGGTIIEMIDENERLVFDFGTAFSGKSGEELNPNVQGIYDNSSKYNDLVLISHLHLDHTKAMNLIDKQIPIVMSEQSNEFINELYNIGFDQIRGQRREYQSIKYNETIKHGNFQITCLQVDHNVPGACAFLIQSPDVSVLYSGDFCLHGRNQSIMPKFLKDVKVLVGQPDVYISEGVSVSFIEADYQLKADKNVELENLELNFPKLVIDTLSDEKCWYVNPYIMDMQRIESLFDLATQVSRTMVLTPKFAKIISNIYPKYKFKVLAENREGIKHDVVSYSEIDETMIVFFDYQQKEKYPKANESAAMLQIGGEPLGDFDYRWDSYMSYLEEQNYTLYKIGSGGHASPENLLYIAEQINAKYTMPLHSFKPELLQGENINQLMPIQDKKYQFNDHELV